MRIYAIGDIHGHLDLLRAAHRLIAADGGADARIVHLGDLIDRGPDSRGVIEALMQGQAQGRDWIVIKGNHDRLLAQALSDPGWIDPCLSRPLHWLDHPGLGAAATLRSYGLAEGADTAALVRAVPRDHCDWLAGLPLWHREAGALFVHAGIRPGIALDAQTEDDCLWIRRPFLDSTADHGALVVHGHTPVKRVTHYGNRLAIDTGAAHGGPLSAIVIQDGTAHLLTETGRMPLQPEV